MILELEMPITDDVRRQLKAWLSKDKTRTLYQISKATGVSWQALKRFVADDTAKIMSDHLDAIASFLSLRVTEDDAPKKSPPKKSPKK